jgi:hypothetical protein
MPHRVQNKNMADHYSVPIFFDADMVETIECLPVCMRAG